MKYLSAPRILLNYGLGVPADHSSTCTVCNERPAQVFFNEHPMFRINQVFPCKECFKELVHEGSQWYEKNPTSIWKNDAGHEIAVDQRGKQMNTNPYDTKYRPVDQHGWMQTNRRDYKKNLERQGIL